MTGLYIYLWSHFFCKIPTRFLGGIWQRYAKVYQEKRESQEDHSFWEECGEALVHGARHPPTVAGQSRLVLKCWAAGGAERVQTHVHTPTDIWMLLAGPFHRQALLFASLRTLKFQRDYSMAGKGNHEGCRGRHGLLVHTFRVMKAFWGHYKA